MANLELSSLLLGVAVGFLITFGIFLSFKRQAKQEIFNLSWKKDRTLKDQIAEVEGERAKLSAILDHITEGIVACDSQKHILIVNPALERILKVHKEKTFGKNVLEILRSPKADALLEQVLKDHSIVTDEIEVHHPEKKVLRLVMIGISHKTVSQSVAGILVVSDVTKVRKLEHLRRDFVANVSHELRTPLTSIKGFAETLLAGALQDREKSVSFLNMMNEDVQRLTRLIDDLLELSQIESDEVFLQMKPIHLKSEIDCAVTLFSPQIQEKQIQVENNVSSEIKILADSDRLKQVFVNLIDNAVKFNRTGGYIRFSADPKNDFAEIHISDTGIGIPEKSVPHIFERFYRVDKARSREAGGTGLGLSIVKHIVEAHGGNVSCHSRLNEGSTFSFSLKKA